MVREVIKRIGRSYDETRVFSYVQRYEFESLLFSDVGMSSKLPHTPRGAVTQLNEIRSDFHTPEDINDSSETAPSKRIRRLIPRYDKRNDGPDLAALMGLEVIRQECKRFDGWVAHLESLSLDPG